MPAAHGFFGVGVRDKAGLGEEEDLDGMTPALRI